MAGLVCAGCGKVLPRPDGRGRPATYHGPACRQRARRARLVSEPGRADLLALLDRAGRAIASARRAALSGEDPGAALAELTAVAQLTALWHASDGAPSSSTPAENPTRPAPE